MRPFASRESTYERTLSSRFSVAGKEDLSGLGPWQVVSSMREENAHLRVRIRELESAVDEALDVVVGTGCALLIFLFLLPSILSARCIDTTTRFLSTFSSCVLEPTAKMDRSGLGGSWRSHMNITSSHHAIVQLRRICEYCRWFAQSPLLILYAGYAGN